MIGVRDIFRIGIGPSSSHTVGPMKAAAEFAKGLQGGGFARVRCELMGSLAWTGAGHATDKAVMLGLAGHLPDTIDPGEMDAMLGRAAAAKRLCIAGRDIAFDPATDILFDRKSRTPAHPNTLRFTAFADDGGELLSERWCSIGGGFIARESEVGVPAPTSWRTSLFLLPPPGSCCRCARAMG